MLRGAPGAGQHPCRPTGWGLAPVRAPEQTLCSSLEPLFLRKSAPAVAVGRWCCQETGGGVRVELDWEDCIAEGQQEPARGVGGAPSPFNRESLFLTASPLD